MTTEVVIMNKFAVAMATDSAVTISTSGASQGSQKIFNSVNKLFQLSYAAPIGIMIYSSAEFIGIPWETIIKEYRLSLGKNVFPALQQYAKDFLKYISNSSLITKDFQERYLKQHILSVFMEIFAPIKKLVSEDARKPEHIFLSIIGESLASINKCIDNHQEIQNTNKQKRAKIRKAINGFIDEVVDEFSEQQKIKEDMMKFLFTHYREYFIDTITNAFFIRLPWVGSSTGIVISGFGDKDVFPSTYSYHIEGCFEFLKYWEYDSHRITLDDNASIIPFAQSDVIETFLNGVNPEYNNEIRNLVPKLTQHFPVAVEKLLIDNDIDSFLVSKVTATLSRLGEKWAYQATGQFQEYLKQVHITPVIRAVAFLPHDELAKLAESLINLTSIKRRMSTDSETVGGPCDVAVITKGDGFIWIDRKHYFDPKLNHRYFGK